MIDAAAPAARCLAFLVAHFDGQGWDLPARRYVAAGAPAELAVDDEHLCVALAQIVPGASDLASRGGGVLSRGVSAVSVPRASYAVRLVRCVPTVESADQVPSADELHASGLVLLADPGRLVTALMAWRETEMHPRNPNATVTVGQVDPMGPAGGMAGHVAVITMAPVQ